MPDEIKLDKPPHERSQRGSDRIAQRKPSPAQIQYSCDDTIEPPQRATAHRLVAIFGWHTIIVPSSMRAAIQKRMAACNRHDGIAMALGAESNHRHRDFS
jgi:hypothetical protein